MFWKGAFEESEKQGEGTYQTINLRVSIFNSSMSLGTTSNRMFYNVLIRALIKLKYVLLMTLSMLSYLQAN